MSVSNFPNIRQVHSTICWAACIEMVARFIHGQSDFDHIPGSEMPLQRRILKEYYTIEGSLDANLAMLTSFCEIGDGYPSLRPEKKYYQEILKKVFGINAKQRFQANIPSFASLRRYTDAGKPVVLGMKYPGIVNGNHAVVVTHCQISEGVKLIRVVDPFASQQRTDICTTGPGKIAYLDYNSLYNRNEQEPALVSVTTNFLKLAVTLQAMMPLDDAGLEPSDMQNTGGIEDIRNMVMGFFLDESIFRVRLEDLKVREAVITSHYQTLTAFLNNGQAEELKLLKVLAGKKESLEIMISEKPATDKSAAVFEFVGIRESYFTDENVASVKLKFGGHGTGRHVNHFEPNYTLLHLQPGDLTFMVFRQGEENCYVSLSNLPTIGVHYKEPYTFEELQNIILKAFPKYIEYESKTK
ncbi:C39 family peptidase [Dyadobacter chenwenxiniae]|uniref:C39 family peptidase n=1 Tax=Dyadobacter chenwenxiniae TaxID=2906456 RepID=A0A9X1PMD5_9BACT|nr:C39 family peptidase [Dyadobacter chenwenxiniae]MCF0062914.1 C39 family peptidase [Dyadobacter chenwenxiniae]UON84912.1 C39 family peptidase [Dyadobacter chenwenxiniae]